MNENLSICAYDNIVMAPEIKAIMPDVLIKYLIELILSESWQKCSKQLLILETEELNGHDIQNIYHIGVEANLRDTRKIFGVKPINCMLEILNSHGNYQMQLCKTI